MKFRRIRAIFILITIIFISVQAFKEDSFLRNYINRNKIIIIDAGHGGKDPGTIGINNVYEKDVNLDISKKLYRELKKMGHKVVLTRTRDEYVENPKRAHLANKRRARVFVSIHCNALENNTTTKGIQVLYFPDRESNIDDPDNEVLARMILDKLLLSTEGVDKGVVEREDLIVLNQTNMPAVIVETGFLSSRDEAELLITNEYQDKIVDGIIEGLISYFGDK